MIFNDRRIEAKLDLLLQLTLLQGDEQMSAIDDLKAAADRIIGLVDEAIVAIKAQDPAGLVEVKDRLNAESDKLDTVLHPVAQ